MADQAIKNQNNDKKKDDKAAKKALKKQAKEEKKKAKLEKQKKNKTSEKKGFLTLKKLIIFSILFLVLLGSAFFIYKTYFSAGKEPVEYKSVILTNVNLPDEMLEFSFYRMNDLYFAMVNYNLRTFLLNKEIDRISKIQETYPDQAKIADKEKKVWIKAKSNIEKSFLKIEKQVKELFVLYNVNKEEGLLQIQEKNQGILTMANEALKTLDPFIEKIEADKEKEPNGFINKTLNKIKNIF